MINGFYIDRSGSFTLNISYYPQQLFWYGAGISLATIIAISAFLLIAYRQGTKEPTTNLVARVVKGIIFQRSSRRQILIKPLVRLLEKSNAIPNTRSLIVDEAKSFNDNQIQEPVKASTAEPEFNNEKLNNYARYLVNLQKEITKMIRINPSCLPIILAVGLIICVPFLVMIREDIANTVAAYALDSLAVGMITGLLLPINPKAGYPRN